MLYMVRVRHSSNDVEDHCEEFEKDTRDADELESLHDEAVRAYSAAVQAYDQGHTVSLFRSKANDGGRGLTTIHESLGTGSGVLSDEKDDDDDDDESAPKLFGE